MNQNLAPHVVFFAAIQCLSVTGLEAQTLTHGPVVGGVTATEAKVFLRSGAASSVAVEYGTDADFGDSVVSEAVVTDESQDFTANISLTELAPETTYFLNVLVDGVPQFEENFPFFATFPPAGSARDFQFVVLADFGPVAKLTADVATFASASAESPAFAFIGGDFDHSNPATLSSKRQMLKDLYNPETRFMSGLVPLILWRMPIVRQWDDHDAGLNNLDKNYADWAISQQVFEEFTPTYELPSISPGIWQRFDYAQAEFFVLDCRSQRDPGLDPDGPDKSMLDGEDLGAAGQLEWLKNGLLSSTARWKIIFTSVITNPTTKQNDSWGAYPTEWNALKTFILENNIENVVFISGDLHLAAIDDGSQAGFPEMCVLAANQTRTGFCATGLTGTWSEGFFDDSCAGYGLVTVLQDPDQLILQALDQDGVIRVAYTVSAATPTPTPTPTPTVTPTPTPTATPTPSDTPTPTPTATPTPSDTPTPTPSATPTPSETPTPSPTPQAPEIVEQPARTAVRAGSSATFDVLATGSDPLIYVWTKNGVEIPGTNQPSYTTPPTTTGDNGTGFAVTVSNEAGSVTSNQARLRVR